MSILASVLLIYTTIVQYCASYPDHDHLPGESGWSYSASQPGSSWCLWSSGRPSWSPATGSGRSNLKPWRISCKFASLRLWTSLARWPQWQCDKNYDSLLRLVRFPTWNRLGPGLPVGGSLRIKFWAWPGPRRLDSDRNGRGRIRI